MQAYLATGEALDELIRDADLDIQTERRVRTIENIVDALSPSNFLVSNPAAIKAAVSSRGACVRGAGQFASDMRTPPRLPSMVDIQFEVGVNLATTKDP